VTICPCCGFKFSGALIDGCQKCGARAVGDALPKPSHVLPSYGRSLALTVFGSLTVLVFIVQTVIAIFARNAKSFGFWSFIAAAQTASWRLKWIAIPVTILTVWAGRKLYRSIKQQPERFCGLRYARRGLLATATVLMLIAVLIGVTVPARMRQRQMRIEASIRAEAGAAAVAFLQLQLRQKSLPPDQAAAEADLAKLADPDGSIATALRVLETGSYQPRAEVAAVSTEKPMSLRGAAIRKASFNSTTDDSTIGGLAYTRYELRLPGEDKTLGNEDDWVVRDGVVMKLADVSKGVIGQTAGTLRP
jgi:hypothetical protein